MSLQSLAFVNRVIQQAAGPFILYMLTVTIAISIYTHEQSLPNIPSAQNATSVHYQTTKNEVL